MLLLRIIRASDQGSTGRTCSTGLVWNDYSVYKCSFIFTMGSHTQYSMLQPERATNHLLCHIQGIFFIKTTGKWNSAITWNENNTPVFTVSPSDAAGRVAPGSDELLGSSSPSGRAARWEPNERVHERRLGLCGDGASWRPAGPVHFFYFIFFNLTGPSFFSLSCISPHSCPPHPQPPHQQTGELGLPALDGYISSTTLVSKWFNVSFVQNHICPFEGPPPRESMR